MAQYLYQTIMSVPGLSGTWKERLSQYYKQLTGKTYRGTADEGNYMLAQIAKKNYESVAPKKTAAPAAAPSLALQYTDPITGQVKQASAIPQFENVMPFYDAWSRMIPQATSSAQSQIQPEVNRTLKSNYNDYMGGLTSSGGQRFGQGLAGVGNIKAASGRDYNAQLQDWLSSYRTGYQDLFYNPSRDAWNTSRTQMQPNQVLEAPKIPTWEDLYGQMNNTVPAPTV